MKSIFKILGGIATVLALVALAAPASAQCPQVRSFGGAGGKGGATVVIDQSAFQNVFGNEMAQFWQSGNSSNRTGADQATSTCPSQGNVLPPWYSLHGPSLNNLVNGFVSTTGCLLPTLCPDVGDSLTFLVEDQTADGSNAGFVTYKVDDTPAGQAWYDLSRTDPLAGSGTLLTHVMVPYPTVFVTNASGTPPLTVATNDYAEDVGIAFHGVSGPANTPLPGSDQIDSYDVVAFSGADPGRDRSLWTPVQKVAYNDAAILSDSVDVPCDGGVNTVLAIGLTIDGVETEFVGPASVPIACDPAIADPNLTPKVRRPAVQRKPTGRRGR
jgi:hypothetical protein